MKYTYVACYVKNESSVDSAYLFYTERNIWFNTCIFQFRFNNIGNLSSEGPLKTILVVQ